MLLNLINNITIILATSGEPFIDESKQETIYDGSKTYSIFITIMIILLLIVILSHEIKIKNLQRKVEQLTNREDA